MVDYINIRTLGAAGDGVRDDAPLINAAIANGKRRLLFPAGIYLLGETLRLRSGAEILASPDAVIRLKAGAQKGRNDFLVTNDGAAVDISISGGVWDANSAENNRGDDLFDPSATSGSMFSFRGVRRLRLSNMTLKNPLCYYLRFCEARDVTLENLIFHSEDLHINQDGIHLAGYCSDFVIRNLYGRGGSPGDDFIALNADDCLTRQESFDMVNGPQENILIENVFAEECHCFVRLLSVFSPIKNVTIRNLSGICRGTAINMDAARYCRVPLFAPDDPVCRNGVGLLENIRIENVNVGRPAVTEEQYITAETNVRGLEIVNFTANTPCACETLRVRNLAPHRIEFVSETQTMRMDTALGQRLAFNAASFLRFTLDEIG